MILLLLSFYSDLYLLLSLAPLWIDWLLWQLVGNVPVNWSKALSKLIQFTNHHVLQERDWKESQSGFGFGLEIQVKYFLMEMQSYIMDENIAWKN